MAKKWFYLLLLGASLFLSHELDLLNILQGSLAGRLGLALYHFFIAGLLLSAYFFLGRAFLSALGLSPERPAERLFLFVLAGSGLTVLGSLALGGIRLLSFWTIYPLLVFSLALSLRERKALPECPSEGFPRGRVSIILGVLILLFALSSLGLATSPIPQADPMNYQLGIPNVWLRAGRLFLLEGDPLTSGLTGYGELLYILPLALVRNPISSHIVAQLLHLLVGSFLGALAIYALTLRVSGDGTGGTRLYGMLAALLFLALRHDVGFERDLTILSVTAKNDLYLMSLELGSLLLLLMGRERKWLLLSGALAGLALGTKIAAGFFILGVNLALLLTRRASRREILLWDLAALALVSPYLVKNLMFLGNPFFPLLSGVFPSPLWPETLRASFGQEYREWLNRGKEFSAYFSPLLLTLKANPLFFIIPASIPFLRRWREGFKFLFLATLFLLSAWSLATGPKAPLRFILVALALSCVLSSNILEEIAGALGRRRKLLELLPLAAALVLALSISHLENRLKAADRALMSPLSYEERLERYMRVYRLQRWMNQNLPREARLLSLFRPERYYSEHEVFVAIMSLDGVIFTERKDPRKIYEVLKRHGITHFYYVRERPLPEKLLPKAGLFLKTIPCNRFVKEMGGVRLYEIDYERGPGCGVQRRKPGS